jgi:hypothetical protein
MPEKNEHFKNLTAGIQSIVFATAVIIGGIWTAYTFKTLGARERAEFDREKAQIEIDRDANFGLDVSVEAKQESFTGRGYYISALVKITNKGIHNRFIDFTNGGLDVEKVEFENTNSTSTYLLTQPNRYTSIVLRTGTTVNCPFVVKVGKPGFYILSYDVPLNDEEMKIHLKSGGPNGPDISWSGSAVILVK